jgi:hypothetical protein
MRKLIILLAVFLGSMATMFAQDIITLKNGDDVKAKVQEIGLSDVKYKRYENLDGPTYTLSKAEIFMIKYENGEKDVFKDEVVAVPEDTQKRLPDASVTPVPAPLAPETLKVEDSFFGVHVVNNKGRVLNEAEVQSLLADIPNAMSLYRTGKTELIVGQVISTVGAAMLGWELGTLLSAPEKSNYTTMGIGVGASVFGLIYYYTGYGKLKRSMTLYNNAKTGRAANSLHFGVTSSGGIGITYNF